MNFQVVVLIYILFIPWMRAFDKFRFADEKTYPDIVEFEEAFQADDSKYFLDVLGELNLWRELINHLIINNKDGRAQCGEHILPYYLKKNIPPSAYQKLAKIFISLTENQGIPNSSFIETTELLSKIQIIIYPIQVCLIGRKFIPNTWDEDLSNLISLLEKLGGRFKYISFKSIVRTDGKSFLQLLKEKITNRIEVVFKALGVSVDKRTQIIAKFANKFGSKLEEKFYKVGGRGEENGKGNNTQNGVDAETAGEMVEHVFEAISNFFIFDK